MQTQKKKQGHGPKKKKLITLTKMTAYLKPERRKTYDILNIQLIFEPPPLSSGRPASFETTAAVASHDVGFAARAPVLLLVEAPFQETVAVLADRSWAAIKDREVRRGGHARGDVVAHFVVFVFAWFGVLVAVMNGFCIGGKI